MLTDLLQDLLVRGTELSIEDGKLRIRAPEGVLPPELLETLRRHKEEILRLLPEYRFEAPLSIGQEGLWFIQASAPDSSAYNVGAALRIESDGDHRRALRGALQKLVNRHTLLRTTFATKVGIPRQLVHAYRTLDLPEIDAADLSMAEVLKAASVVHLRPFDLEAEGAFRACLFRRGPGESLLVLCVHHIAIDGWSLRMMVDELVRVYEADGRANPLPPLTHTYQQFVRGQRDMLAARGEELRRFWVDELKGASLILDLPTDRPRPPAQTFRGAMILRALAPARISGLRALARAQGTTINTIFLAAFQVLLHRYTGQEDFCVGSAAALRDNEALAGTFGYLVNQIVLRAQISAASPPDFLSIVQQTRERVLAMLDRQEYPFPLLAKELLSERDPSRAPVAQVGYVFQRTQEGVGDAATRLLEGETVEVGGAQFSGVPLPQEITELDLVLEVIDDTTRIVLRLRYNTDLFDAGTIEQLAGHLETLLGGVESDPGRPISQLPLLTGAEREQLVVEWNRTAAPFSSEACIHHLFEAHADRTPDAVALVDLCGRAAGGQGTAVTYRELDRRANQVAHHLLRLGVRPDTPVGLCLERSADLIVGLLGILKAGGAFVVLDPEHPRRRLSFLLEDTGVSVVLTRGSLLSTLPETRAHVVDFERGFSDEPAGRPRSGVGPGHLAYVQYTSGSTGEPNGALIEHRGLVNSTEAHIRIMETGPGARHWHVLSFNFDGAIAHLFVMICAGGALYLAPRDSDFLGAGLIERMAREAITHTALVPTMLAALPEAELPSLRTLVVCGEKCSAELVTRWGRQHRLINLYGPTEVSILATSALCVPDGNPPPIGRPIPNLCAYVVDRWEQLAPLGVIGELWLGGVGVARSYLNRPELTARKFIDNPFGEGRVYRTGDLVRYRMTDGGPPVLEFVGRADTQVKIRGYRIELSEVENVLRALPQVRDAVVTVYEDAAKRGALARLVAYVAAARQERSSTWELAHIATWNAISDHVDLPPGPAATPVERDLTLDLRGWKSSYTGEDIPPEQMRAWVESTVARILALAPCDVLEIGCGTGMLLTRVAPRTRSYRATDLARHAIDHVEALKARLPGLDNVRVSQQPAHDLTGLTGAATERFDTVILNSVVQYFPSADYLAGVIEGLLGLMGPTGSIFIGDVRNLALLETYHAAVASDRAGGTLRRRELRNRVQRALLHENELVLHPGFFTALRAAFPRIVGVEIAPKRGSYRNELSLFRYDVTLRIGAEPAQEAPIVWHELGAEGLTLAGLRAWIARLEPGRALGLRGIPNARLNEEGALVRWLAADNDEHHLPWQPPPADPRAWEPEALYALEAELSCRIHLSWGAGRPDGSLDAIVTTGDLPPPRFPLDAPAVAGRWADHANDPLQSRRYMELTADLRRELCEALPPHLVPSAIVVLPALPLTLNGKVDIRALPPPEAVRDTPADAAELRTDAERKLAEVWCSVLGLPRVGVHDNFFELGGDSILSMQIVARAQALGLTLRPGQIFEHQTVARLAAAAGGQAITTEQGVVSGPVPLTPIQRWFFEQDRPAPNHFNQAFVLETPPDLDIDLLRRALHHLLMHHDALRMRFERTGSTWTQRCLAAVGEVALESTDLSSLPPDEQDAPIQRAAARLQSSLDISAGPLMRVAAIRLGENRPGRLLWVVHHLVVDVVSWRVLLPDLGTAYRQLAAGQPVELPAKTTSFKRWAERLNELARSAPFDDERAILAFTPPVPLPVDRPGAPNRRETGGELRVQLSKDETSSLIKDALRPYNLGVQDILLTALAQAVARFSGSAEVWVDLEGHGREELFDDVDLSRTVGWFTSLFPVRLCLPSDGPAEALMAIKEQLRAVPRRGVRYGLLRYLHEEGEQLPWPRPEINFNYLGRLRSDIESPGEFRLVWESAGATEAPVGARSHVLVVNGLVADDHIELVFGYSRDLHDVATVERLANEVLGAIRHLLHHCLSPEAGAWTPSDFPFAGLDQRALHDVIERFGETRRSKIEAIYPITSLQREMLFETLNAKSKVMYMTQAVLSFQGELDVAALRSAWEHVVRQHSLLRSCFVWQGLAEPVQVVSREVAMPWTEHDWRDTPDRGANPSIFGEELVAHGIPLDAAPVMNLTLVRTADQHYLLFYDCHHMLTDGWSLGQILRGVFDAYRAARQGNPPRDIPTGSYEGYLRWMGKLDQERSEVFWRRVMHGFKAPTPLVMERALPAGEHRYTYRSHRLDASLTARLNAVAEAEHVTPHTLLDGAWALLLSRTSGLRDVVFGTTVSGREGNVPGIESLVGLFIHMLPVRAHIDEDRDVWTWLRALQAEQVEAREHQHLSLAEIQRIAAVPADTLLFRSMVVFENYPLDLTLFSSQGLTVALKPGAAMHTHHPLTVSGMPGQELDIFISYDVAYFDPRSIGWMAEHMEELLRAMIGAPASRLGELLSLSGGGELRELRQLDGVAREINQEDNPFLVE